MLVDCGHKPDTCCESKVRMLDRMIYVACILLKELIILTVTVTGNSVCILFSVAML